MRKIEIKHNMLLKRCERYAFLGLFKLMVEGVGWLAGLAAGWLAGRLAGWSAGGVVGWPAGRLAGWQAGSQAGVKVLTASAFLFKICVLCRFSGHV